MFTTSMSGSYKATPPLANVTIAGVSGLPKNVDLTVAGEPCETRTLELEFGAGVLYVKGIEDFTRAGAWEAEITMKLTF